MGVQLDSNNLIPSAASSNAGVTGASLNSSLSSSEAARQSCEGVAPAFNQLYSKFLHLFEKGACCTEVVESLLTFKEWLIKDDQLPPQQRALALNNLALALLNAGNLELADELIIHALRLGKNSLSSSELVVLTRNMANVAALRGDLDFADNLLDGVAQRLRSDGRPPFEVGQALSKRARLLMHFERHEKALEVLQELEAQQHESGGPKGVIWAQTQQGVVWGRLGQWERAQRKLSEALNGTLDLAQDFELTRAGVLLELSALILKEGRLNELRQYSVPVLRLLSHCKEAGLSMHARAQLYYAFHLLYDGHEGRGLKQAGKAAVLIKEMEQVGPAAGAALRLELDGLRESYELQGKWHAARIYNKIVGVLVSRSVEGDTQNDTPLVG